MSKCVGNIGSTVLTRMHILAVSSRTQAYTLWLCSQTGHIPGISAPT